LQEFQQGLISVNEYRSSIGRKKVESDIADSLLSNPNLTPIANTEKPMEDPNAQAAAGAVPGMAGGAAQIGAQMAGGQPPAGAEGQPQGQIPAGMEPIPQGGVQAGVPLSGQGTDAAQTVAAEFSPEQGAFVPLGTVEGAEDIELPASQVPSELDELEPEEEEEGEKSLPFQRNPIF